jgi:hypothetical protein
MGNRSSTAQQADRITLSDIRRELAALNTMTIGELAEKYREVFGVPTRSRNGGYLRKHIAWRIQELQQGGLSPRALERIGLLAPQAPARWHERIAKPTPRPEITVRDPRLPPAGTMLTRVYDGAEHKVKILDQGFEYRGKRYRSLSQVAKLITHTPWNGFTFFLGRGAAARGDQTGGAP